MLKKTVLLLFISIIGVNLYAASSEQSIALLQQQVNELNERVDGLITLVEGYNATISKLQENQKSLNMLEEKIGRVDRECKRESLNPTESNQSSMVQQSQIKNDEHINSNSEEKSLDTSEDNADLYREGAQFFQKKQYDKSKKRFLLMVEKNYKSASSNYYLGEIAYYTKEYNDAIYYFKKSVKLNDKASYIDILMLHTAISLEQTGDKSQSTIFYQTIVNDYPDKKSAKIALEHLQKI